MPKSQPCMNVYEWSDTDRVRIMMHLKNDMNSFEHYILLILLYLTKMSHLNAGYITFSELEEHVSARYKEKACGLHFLYTTAVKIVK